MNSGVDAPDEEASENGAAPAGKASRKDAAAGVRPSVWSRPRSAGASNQANGTGSSCRAAGARS